MKIEPGLAGLPLKVRNELEILLMEFEQEWQPDRLADFVSRIPEYRSQDYVQLAVAELVKIDLHRFWATKQSALVESYLEQFPQLKDNATICTELLFAEFEARRACEPQLQLESYEARFPESYPNLCRLVAESKNSGHTIVAPHEKESTHQAQASVETSRVAKPDGDQRQRKSSSLPKEFGRYQIVRELGSGAMGAVYLAHDTKLERHVAIKTPSFNGDNDEELIARFSLEARAAAKIHHRNICPIFDVGEIDGRHFISMAFIKGRPMSELINADKLPAQKSCAVLTQRVANALAEAHRHHVVHRDLKPANIMIDTHREPVVMDFGLARQTNVEKRMTQSGLIVGTPAYMSPEQITGDLNEVTPAVDIYALGVILYELLTGQLPFRGTITQVIYKITSEEPPPPSKLRADVDPNLESICLKMMAKQRDHRYDSMEQVSADLKAYIKGSTKLKARQSTAKATKHKEAKESQSLTESEAINAFLMAQDHSDEQQTIIEPARRTSIQKGKRFSKRTAKQKPLWQNKKLVAASFCGGVLLLLGVTILFKGGKVELDDNSNAIVEVEGDGSLRIRSESPKTELGGKTATVPRLTSDASPEPAPAIAPFNADQAKQHQEAWAKYLGTEVETTNSIGMKFRVIPPGEFLMGSSDEEIAKLKKEATEQGLIDFHIEVMNHDGPQHQVILTRPFEMGIHEVTRGQFRLFVKETGYITDAEKSGLGGHGYKEGKEIQTPEFLWDTRSGRTAEQNDEHPVVYVSWNDAIAFCEWLSQKEGVTYRLPTEAEWAFACRAGTLTRYCFGDDDSLLGDFMCFRAPGRRSTTPVGEYRGNAFGLFDLHGNATEWCHDFYEPYSNSAEIDPLGSHQGFLRVRRGGCFLTQSLLCRTAIRFGNGVTVASDTTGFRIVRTMEKPKPKTTHISSTDEPAPALAPFNADEAKQHQAAWAKHLGTEVETTNSIGMKFRVIPPGEFLMGSSDEEIAKLKNEAKEQGIIPFHIELMTNDGPQHRVILTRPFEMGIHEVTRGQFRLFVEETGYITDAEKSGLGGLGIKDGKRIQSLEFLWNTHLGYVASQNDEHPVVNVSWNDALAFCEWLSQKEGIIYRLPTEAQWEFACRAGSLTRYCFGDDDSLLSDYMCFQAQCNATPVGEYQANAFGLFDLHGNVAEWCHDSFEQYSNSTEIDPLGSYQGFLRVRRGGIGLGAPSLLLSRSAIRYGHMATLAADNTGFRIVRTIEKPKTKPKTTHIWPNDEPAPAIAPFNADEAKQHQEEWAKYLGTEVETTNSIGMKFRVIPPGEFLMGSSDEEIAKLENEAKEQGLGTFFIKSTTSDGPQHQVILTKPFEMGIHEVTRGQFRLFVEETGYITDAEKSGLGGFGYKDGKKYQSPEFLWDTRSGRTAEQNDQHPVVFVSWHDALAFCEWLSQKEGVTYRLPTEAEWAFACRAGTLTRYCFGDDDSLLGDFMCFKAPGSRSTTPVGEYLENAFGLFDVHGNVVEWCHNFFEPYINSTEIDPLGSLTGVSRVRRGGAFGGHALLSRSALRFGTGATVASDFIGFRIVRTMEKPKLKPKATHIRSTDEPAPAVAPFNAKDAKKHQEEWAKYLGTEVETTNSIGMKFRVIPPGEFLMGSSDEEIAKLLAEIKGNRSAERSLKGILASGPQHKVTLTRPFEMSMGEVTRGQFREFVVATSYQTDAEKDGRGGFGVKNDKWVESPEFLWNTNLGFSTEQTDEHPVVNVSWNDAVAFCEWLSKKEVATYRLPTEAEWEFACRSGSQSRYSFGDEESDLERYAWYEGSHQTYPVKQKESNVFGLFDMHGNVSEWCYDSEGKYSSKPAIDPSGPTNGVSSVVRGGHINIPATGHGSALRYGNATSRRNNFTGFRIVRAIGKPKPKSKTTHIRPTDEPAPAITPFNAVQAKKHQVAWAKHLDVKRKLTLNLGGRQSMTLMLIPPGEFLMGSTNDNMVKVAQVFKAFGGSGKINQEGPQHLVRLTQPFFIGAHEVTRGQFRRFIKETDYKTTAETTNEANASTWKTAPRGQNDAYPVVYVSFDDSVAYCEWLSKKFDSRFQLPTEAQWEYACRAGTAENWCFGDNLALVTRYVRCKKTGSFNVGISPLAVGSLLPNAFGLHDMHGNVVERCSDRKKDYESNKPVVDPTGPKGGGSGRVVRGGSWRMSANHSRSAQRDSSPKNLRHDGMGFRVMMTIDPTKLATQNSEEN